MDFATIQGELSHLRVVYAAVAAVLARAEVLAKGRDPAADDAALAAFGEVDPVDWSLQAVRTLLAGGRQP